MPKKKFISAELYKSAMIGRVVIAGKFTEDKWEKSALSMHAKDMHQDQFSLNNFSVSVVKKVSPQQLRREEFRFIDKYRTISLGLNRYKV